jgi:hypothetical protein
MQQTLAETDEMFIKKGEMKKNPFTMSKEELAVWKTETNLKIRERLFAIGQPLVYETNAKLVAEYADGRIE